MAQRPKRGPSRLTPQPDPHVERLRREVDEEFRRLSVDDSECCVAVRAAGIDIGERTWINFIQGANITISATDDAADDEVDVIIAASGGLSEEEVEDIIGATVIAGTDIAVTYSDVAGTVTIDYTGAAGFTQEQIEDFVAALAVAGHGMVITYADGTPSLTFDVDESALDSESLGIEQTDVADSSIYEVDLSALANNTFVNGTEVVDGLNWTIANTAAANAFEVLNGSGIHFDANATNSAFTSATQTASYLTTTWGDLLGSNFDPFGVYAIDFRIASTTMAVAGNKVTFFVTNAAAFTDTGGIDRINSAGNQAVRHHGPGSSSAGQVVTTPSVVTLLVEANLVRSYYGTYSGGWPANDTLVQIGQNSAGTAGSADAEGYLRSNTRIGISFATGETGAAMDAVVSMIRVRKVS